MGFEEINHYRKTCDCGKGEIEILSEMDDWNRIRHQTTLHCDECRKKEELENKKLTAEYQQQQYLRNETRLYFDKKYYDVWEELLDNYRTKKDKFNYLVKVEVLSSYTSESYFLNSYKKADIPKSVLQPKNIKKILKLLKIKDDDYSKKLDELIELDRKSLNRSMAAYHRG